MFDISSFVFLTSSFLFISYYIGQELWKFELDLFPLSEIGEANLRLSNPYNAIFYSLMNKKMKRSLFAIALFFFIFNGFMNK